MRGDLEVGSTENLDLPASQRKFEKEEKAKEIREMLIEVLMWNVDTAGKDDFMTLYIPL